MALTCAEMIDEVKAATGRENDTALITEARVTRWINEAQRDIASKCTALHALTFKNATSHDTTVTLAYAIGDITAGDYTAQTVNRIWDVYYLDGVESQKLTFLHNDEFDAKWPDPTHSDIETAKPNWWTRRAKNIEIMPVCSTEYCDKDLRFDGDYFPRSFSSDATELSDLSEADDLIIGYATSKAWHAIGQHGKAQEYSTAYEVGLDDYKARNDRLCEWDGNLFSDGL